MRTGIADAVLQVLPLLVAIGMATVASTATPTISAPNRSASAGRIASAAAPSTARGSSTTTACTTSGCSGSPLKSGMYHPDGAIFEVS